VSETIIDTCHYHASGQVQENAILSLTGQQPLRLLITAINRTFTQIHDFVIKWSGESSSDMLWLCYHISGLPGLPEIKDARFRITKNNL
jgi:hypothetical protein